MSNSLVEQICTVRNKFDELQKRYNDDQAFSDVISNALNECDLPSISEIKERYYKETNTERLLRIGIVGRVKAGKSSLLNSLVFGGQDILPKAATPMTAALTFLEFGEKPSVTVEFFEQSDINKFSEDAKKYKRLIEKESEVIRKNLEENARRRPSMSQDDETIKNNAIKKIKEDNGKLDSSYDQYQRIQKVFSSVSDKIAKGKEILSIQSINDIKKVLVDYVGESGKYMPITKNVNITFPLPALEGITIVDTPGFNDPVPSRDNKANELLRECDVVLILTITNQMISSEDVEVISRITRKDGIRELYIIASQFDSSLHGREILEASNHKLKNAIDHVKNDTIIHIKEVVTHINRDEIFDTILSEGEKRIFHSSGLCQSMFDTWANKQNWDEGRNHVWKSLVRDFPDDFSNSDAETTKYSLALLGNIKAIQASIQDVKTRKKDIFHKKLMGFQTKYDTAAREAHKKILDYIDKHIKSIKKADLAKIEKKNADLAKFKADMEPAFKNIFDIAIENWESNILDKLNAKLDDFANATLENIENATGTETKRWTTGRWIFKEEHSETYTTINTYEVKNSIQRFIDKMNMMIGSYMEKQNRALEINISSKILQFWLKKYPETMDNGDKIDKRIRSIVHEAIVNISEYSEKPFSNQTGRLTSYEAEEFKAEATLYASKLKKIFSTWIYDNVEATIYNLRKTNFATTLLKDYEEQLNQKKEEVKEPTRALENWTQIQKEVQQIL